VAKKTMKSTAQMRAMASSDDATRS
jgi:hypothetical protein